MTSIIEDRFNELKNRREALTRDLAEFYSGAEYLTASPEAREALEARREIPAARLELWETERRFDLISHALQLPEDEPEAVNDFLELMDGGAMQDLEKGIPEGASRAARLEFIGRGIDCDECRKMLNMLSISKDFKAITKGLKAKREARENAQKGA